MLQNSFRRSPVKKIRRLSTTIDGSKRVPRNVLRTAKNSLDTTDAPSVIVEHVHFQGAHSRRLRTPWTDEECQNLRIGVDRHGSSSWLHILMDRTLNFNENRTTIDLKDKWRNMVHYRQYGARPIRSYILVNSLHQPILNNSGRERVLRNRYPRDAALKVATKDEFYKNGAEFIDIYLRELVGENNCPPMVHVYRGTRQRYIAADIAKFNNAKANTMWVATVEKIKEEQLFNRKNVLELSRSQ